MILVLWLLNLIAFFVTDKHGTFGDTFGAVNSLFSGLAFAGIIYSIRLQQRELMTQQDIMNQQKNEFEVQSAEFKKQNIVLKVQQFESTFTTLLGYIKNIKNEITDDEWTRIRIAFNLYLEAKVKPNYFGFNARIDNGNDDIALGRFLETVSIIVDFVRSSDIQNKEMYYRIISSQLTRFEFNILFYIILFEPEATDKCFRGEETIFNQRLVGTRLINQNHIDLLKYLLDGVVPNFDE